MNINLIDKKKMGQCNKSINNNELFQTIEFKLAQICKLILKWHIFLQLHDNFYIRKLNYGNKGKIKIKH